MDLEKLRVIIESQTAKAEKGFETINELLKQQREELDQIKRAASTSADETVRSFSKWSSAYYRALGLVKQFGATVKSAYSAAAEGAQIQAAESFFKNAGRSIEDLRVATGGMISDAELMKKANLADSMGISMDTFKTLAKVAQASALKTGQSFDHMFESITLGTARSSRLLLDNLGIIVSVEKANQNYAKAQLKLAGDTSITSKEIQDFIKNMDDSAKKTAFAEEVQRQAVGTLQEYAGANAEGAQSFAQFEAALSNMIETLKKMGAEVLGPIIPTLTSLVDGFKNLFELGPQGSVFGETIWSIGRAVAYIASLGKFDVGESATMTEAKTEKIRQRNQLLGTGFTVKAEIEAQLDKLPDYAKVGMRTVDSVIQRFIDVGTTGDKVLDHLAMGFIDLNKQAGSFFGEWKRAVSPEEGKPKPPPKEGRGKSEKDYRYDLWVAFLKEEEDQLKATEEASKKRIDTFNKEMAAMAEDALKLREKIAESTIELGGKGVAMPSQSKALTVLDTKLSDAGIDAADNLEKMAKAAYEADMAFREWAKNAAGGVTTGLATGTGAFGPLLSSFAETAGSAISAVLTASMGAAGAGAIGAIVGALLPVIGSLLDDLKPVAALITAVATGLANFVKLGLGEVVAGLGDLALPLQMLLGAIGSFVGSALRPLSQVFTVLIKGIAIVIGALAAWIIALNPLVEVFTSLISALFRIVTIWLPMESIITSIGDAAKWATESLVRGAVDFNNAIVKFMRNVLQMKGFGKLLKYEDFLAESIDENKTAVEENTRALRDLAREFRNMPAGYKVARTVYDAADASMQPQQSVVMTMSETAASAVSRRWRT